MRKADILIESELMRQNGGAHTVNRLVFSAGLMLLLAAAFVSPGCSPSDNVTSGPPALPPAEPRVPHIVYQREGGLGNLNDSLLIYSGGDCELTRKTGNVYTCRVLPLKLLKIEQAFEQAGFFALPVECPGNSQADAIRYVIDYTAGGNTHRVTAWSNAMPAPLLPVVRELDQCVMLVSITGVR